MYKVEAVIQLEQLDDVKKALVAQGLEEFVVTELRGHDSLEGQTGCYRGITYEIPFKRQIRVELSVPEPALDIVIECIRNAVHSSIPGTGKIFVTQLADVIEISLDRPLPVAPGPPTQNHRSVRPQVAKSEAGKPGKSDRSEVVPKAKPDMRGAALVWLASPT
jgi:nitrogen regulatory protein P-II 1